MSAMTNVPGYRPGLIGQVTALHAAYYHADSLGFPRVYLTTFAGLDAARALYERVGFLLTHEQLDTTWGIPVREQTFERPRPAAVSDAQP